MRQRYLNVAVLLTLAVIAGCATVQQLAIKADMAYATAVFALDDAEFAACHPTVAAPLTAADCTTLDAKVAQALLDVQATTRAIQGFPTTIPKTLPALLTDLSDIQTSLLQLQQVPLVTNLASKTADANAKAIALLTQLNGGK